MDIEYWMEVGIRWNQILKAIAGSRKQLAIKYDEAKRCPTIEIDGNVFEIWSLVTLDQLDEILLKSL